MAEHKAPPGSKNIGYEVMNGAYEWATGERLCRFLSFTDICVKQSKKGPWVLRNSPKLKKAD
jgi:hypothetical protein